MTRNESANIEIRGLLVATTPLLVNGGSEPGLDSVPFRDGLGRLTIPGTSVAGALRDRLRRMLPSIRRPDGAPADDADIQCLFGSSDGASRLVVHDLIVANDAKWTTRDGVGIDRITGAAAQGIKYDRTMLDAGTTFTFEMRLSVATQSQSVDRVLLEALVRELAAGRVRLGSGTNRGCGQVRLRSIHSREISASDASMLLHRDVGWQLILESVNDADDETANAASSAPDQLSIDIAWRPLTPVMSASPGRGTSVDIWPLVTVTGSAEEAELRLVLPGTSIRGALRTRAEYVMRSLLDIDAPCEFQHQIEVPLVENLFGSSQSRGWLAIDDVMSDPIASAQKTAASAADARLRTEWEDIVAASYPVTERLSQVRQAVQNLDPGTSTSVLIPTAHVAIDRWTGGAADGALYSVLEPHGLEWDPIILRLDGHRPSAAEFTTGLTLLLIVLDDLHKGLIPLGFGTHRGLGSIEVQSIESRGDFTSKSDLVEEVVGWLGAPSLEHGLLASLADFDEQLHESLVTAWKQSLGADQPVEVMT
jgi:CRISPR/Cas system CSM-associated protein Csm3 (group 7 of RAMP superfamily)